MNTFINTQIEMKKLQFHTPDDNGKSKFNVMHVGKSNGICPQLQVHGTIMQKITHDTYLGDIIANDGSNDLNIQSRVGKGHGKMTQIMHSLERISLGGHYFKIALILREIEFLSSILTNAEVWYGLSPHRFLLRKILDTPISTPIEGIQLELGVFSIGTIIKARRIIYLHYLLTAGENEMMSKVFWSQWKNPAKNDWTK